MSKSCDNFERSPSTSIPPLKIGVVIVWARPLSAMTTSKCHNDTLMGGGGRRLNCATCRLKMNGRFLVRLVRLPAIPYWRSYVLGSVHTELPVYRCELSTLPKRTRCGGLPVFCRRGTRRQKQRTPPRRSAPLH